MKHKHERRGTHTLFENPKEQRIEAEEQRIKAENDEAVVEDAAVEVPDGNGPSTVEVHAGTTLLKEQIQEATTAEVHAGTKRLEDLKEQADEIDVEVHAGTKRPEGVKERVEEIDADHRLRGGAEVHGRQDG